jgi:putative flippase GtrA
MFDDVYEQPTKVPTRKVAAGSLAAALSFLLVWVLGIWFDVPAEAASSFTTIIGFLVAFFVPDKNQI